ncbi:MAG: sulfotransferase [Geminocystis sp.]|nr:sulfotransferase [Geminocystis sp.]MCS7147891.1 sulfotransferase [Geminocystis sp.]MDW8117021.1 sulfotransferase [Geminocystis sp.]MDW8462439.1 sulfotransferase [Geminocystis sp.]
MDKKPDFIIIGAMKCATTTLHEQLARQPGIFMTKLKEPNFFSNDEEYEKGIYWYFSLFSGAKQEDICGESSTHYTKLPTYPHTVERMKGHLPDVKLIYVMRHPIDRLISQYIHEWTQRVINTDINLAIDTHPELIAYSRYSMQIKPYFEAYGKEKVLPVFFERLLKNPQEELERICHFIGYNSRPKWHELGAVNDSSQRMRPRAWRDFLVEMPILKTIRKKLIPKQIRDWVKGFWMMKKRPQIKEDKLKPLRSIFDEELATLGRWLGVELNCENYHRVVIESPLLDWRGKE